MGKGPDNRYFAFVSYSHRDSGEAKWLHRQLEAFRLPSGLQEGVSEKKPERLRPVFLDRQELASSADLKESIVRALERSTHLIVICSPEAADSKYVNAEIEAFQEMGKARRIHAVIVRGEPPACFPPQLLRSGHEPIAADMRPNADGRQDAKLKLIAGMLEVGFDALKRRELRRQRRRMLITSVLSITVALVTTFLAIAAIRARNEVQAQEREIRARLSREYIDKAWDAADPATALLWQAESLNLAEAGGQTDRAGRIRAARLLQAHPELKSLTLFPDPFDQVQFNEESGRIATASSNEAMQLWNRETGQMVGSPVPIRGNISGLSFSPDGRYVLLLAERQATVVRSLDGEKAGAFDGIVNGQWGSEGLSLGLIMENNEALLCDLSQERFQARKTQAPVEAVRHLYLDDSSGTTYFISEKGEIVLETGERSGPLAANIVDSIVLESLPRLITVDSGYRVRIWDVSTGEGLGNPVELSQFPYFQWSESKNFLHADDGESSVLIDVRTGEFIPLGVSGRPLFSPDERYFSLTTWQNKSARQLPVLDLQTGEVLRQFQKEAIPETELSQHPAPEDLWDFWTAEPETWPQPPARHRSEEWRWQRKGDWAATAANERSIQLWRDGQAQGPPLEFQAPVVRVDFSSKAGFLMVLSRDLSGERDKAGPGQYWLDVIELSQLKRQFPTVPVPTFEAFGAAVDPEKRYVSVQGRIIQPGENPHYGYTVTWLWDLRDGLPLATLFLPMDEPANPVTVGEVLSEVESVHLSRDGEMLAAQLAGNRVVSYRLDPIEKIREWQSAGETQQTIVEGRLLLESVPEGVKVVDLRTGTVSPILEDSAGQIFEAAISPGREYLAMAHGNPEFRVWRLSDGKPVTDWLSCEGMMLTGLRFSPDGRRLVSVTRLGSNPPFSESRVWDTKTWKTAGPPLELAERGWNPVFSPDGSKLALLFGSSGVRLIDPEDASLLHPVLAAPGGAHAAAFSPDGTLLAVDSGTSTVRLWDVEEGKPVAPPFDLGGSEDSPFDRVEFSPDGAFLLAGGEDGHQLWDVASRRKLTAWVAEAEPLGFRDSRTLVVRSKEGIADLIPLIPYSGDAEILRMWARLKSRLEVSEDGTAVPIGIEEGYNLYRKLAE